MTGATEHQPAGSWNGGGATEVRERESRPGQGAADLADDTLAHPQASAEGAVLGAALGYAAAGLPVLLLEGKLPHRRHAPRGKDSATTDVDLLRDLLVQNPGANIGIRPPDGTVVLDVDPRHGGATALLGITEQRGPLSPTWTADTGGGGVHAWYRAPGPYRGHLCPGVDLKAATGYVVVPPSIHPNGRPYTWATDLPIADAPAWLAELIRRPAPAPAGLRSRLTSKLDNLFQPDGGPRADDALVRTVADAPEGNRNAALHWAACRAAERPDPAPLLDRLRTVAVGNGLELREVERTIDSAIRAAAVTS